MHDEKSKPDKRFRLIEFRDVGEIRAICSQSIHDS